MTTVAPRCMTCERKKCLKDFACEKQVKHEKCSRIILIFQPRLAASDGSLFRDSISKSSGKIFFSARRRVLNRGEFSRMKALIALKLKESSKSSAPAANDNSSRFSSVDSLQIGMEDYKLSWFASMSLVTSLGGWIEALSFRISTARWTLSKWRKFPFLFSSPTVKKSGKNCVIFF